MTWKPSVGPSLGHPDDSNPENRVADSDNRSATAMAAEWASRIMTISLEMVLPGLAGYWLDNKLGSKGLFMLLGFAAGSLIAFKQLLAIAKRGQTPVSKKTLGDSTDKKTELSQKGKL